jgi:PilZ domain
MKVDPPKTWIERLVVGKIPDPRSSERESLPGLVAYFFTGGPPAPHAVRNISTSGLYLETHERWYRGTVVQMTLTDRQSGTFERSLSLYAKAVRLGSDGVGFRFVLEGDRQRPSKVLEAYAPTNGIDSVKVGMFIRNFRGAQQEAEP